MDIEQMKLQLIRSLKQVILMLLTLFQLMKLSLVKMMG